MDKETYRNMLNRQKRTKNISICCVNCGEDDSRVIEMHHIDGRNNSTRQIPLCKNCHSKITQEQNKIPPKSRSSNASKNEKRGSQLVSQGALLLWIGKQQIEDGHEMIEDGKTGA